LSGIVAEVLSPAFTTRFFGAGGEIAETGSKKT